MQLAKITEKVKSEIQTLNREEKTEVLNNFIFLYSNINSVIGLTEPLLLIIDNQILIDLLYTKTDNSEPEYRRRYIMRISVLMLFNYLLSYLKIDVITILTPTIFYEFNQRNIPKNNDDFEITLKKCLSLLEEFEAKTAFWGLDNFKVARQKLQNIEHDEQKIITAINKFKQQNMTFQVFEQMEWHDDKNQKIKCKFFRPPFLVANQVVVGRKIKLKYYDKNIINRVIASHLEPKIYSDSVQTAQLKQQMKNFRHETIRKTASVSRIVKARLKGLADIEILQFCDIGSQFSNNTDYTLFAVTFDEKLLELLQERTKLELSFDLSSQDNAESLEFKEKQYKTNYNRIKFADEKLLEADNQFICFYQDLKPLLD